MNLRYYFGATCRSVAANALALLLLAAGLHFSTEQAAATAPLAATISIETLAVEPVSDVRSVVVDDRPDLARPLPVEAASFLYKTIAASGDRADDLGRVLRVITGSPAHLLPQERHLGSMTPLRRRFRADGERVDQTTRGWVQGGLTQ